MPKVCNCKTLLLCMVLMLTSCSGGISEQVRSQITYLGPFSAVQQEPQKYRGEMVLWGGKIIESQVRDGMTDMVMLQLELDRQDRPQDNDQSHGRYLIRSAQFLDPAIYSPGTLITVAGRLQGSETRSIGQMPYVYPVIEPVEIKKWPAGPDPSPRFHFGIGIGTHL